MRNARHIAVAIFLSFFLSFPLVAHGETIVRCGAMEGYAYYYPSPFVKEDQKGFNDGQVTKNAVAIALDGGQYDVLHRGETQKTYSSVDEGAKVIPIANTKDHFVLFLSYPDKSAEIYTYHKTSKTLTLLQHKYGALVTSSKLMVTNCE